METEAKFIVPDEETFARLREVERFGQYTRRDTVVKSVHDRYVDTSDHSFYHHQLYARLRAAKHQGNGATQPLLLTLKRLGVQAEGGVHERDEFQVEVPGLDVAEWPEGEVKRITEEVAGSATLGDLVRVDQVRTVSTLYKGKRAAAELSLDEITIQTASEPVMAYELEVELLPTGTQTDLKALHRVLTKEYALSPQPLSKFERALMLTTPPAKDKSSTKAEESSGSADGTATTRAKSAGAGNEESAPPAKGKPAMGVLAEDSMGTAGRKIIKVYFQSMLANEDGTREGEDPEALHDMRVATRRMRAALRVLEPYMCGPRAEKARRGLSSVTQALGAVRDLDVLIDKAKKFREELPEDEQADMDGLLNEWQSQRDKGRKRLVRMLDSKEYARFKKGMEGFLDEDDQPNSQGNGNSREVEPYQVRHAAGSAIWSRYEAVRAFETVMATPSMEQLHALRIKGKYLRYTLECFRETLPPVAGDLIRDVVKMQDELGELHDADVAATLVRTHLKRERKQAKKKDQPEEPTPPGLSSYVDYLQAQAEHIQADFSTTWANVDGAKWRGKLAGAIAGM